MSFQCKLWQWQLLCSFQAGLPQDVVNQAQVEAKLHDKVQVVEQSNKELASSEDMDMMMGKRGTSMPHHS
eukprot:5503571-Amphidinium_carterae.1